MLTNKRFFLIIFPLFILFTTSVLGQTTLYSEDFQDANDVVGTSGIFYTTYNAPSDNNWSVVKVGNPGLANSSDYCGVITGKLLEWRDINGNASNRLDWYSKTINVTASNISISIDWVMNGASVAPNANFYFYYRVDGGSWTNFFTRTGQSTLASGTATINSLSCSSTIEIKVEGWTGDASGAYETIDNILIQGTVSSCTPPTTAPSGISFSSITTSSMTVNWTGNGNGDMVLVVAKESGSTLTNPTSGTSYSANTTFGSGTQIGTGNYVIYDADGSTQSVNLTGLTAGTTYDFAIYAYNSTGDCYYLSDYETGSQATECSPPGTVPTNLSFSSVTANSITISWTAGNGTNSLVVVKQSGSTHTDPSAGTSYTANTTFGSGTEIGTGNYVCYNSTGTSFTLNGLTGNTTYDVSVYTFNTSPTCYNMTEEYDSQLTLSFSTYYINDNSTTNDVYTTAVGSDTNSGSSSAPFATITKAITTASNGDIIYIDAGLYKNWENINLTKELSFLGAGNGLTIIDDEFAGTSTNYFMYVTADNVSFKDLTIKGYENNGTQGPSAMSGQALTFGGGATGILIEEVKLSNNGQSGGNPSIVILANCSVTIRGGGSLCNTWHTAYAGGVETNGNGITLNIEDCVIAYNYKYNSYDGGGLLMRNSDATTTVNVTNSYFYNNDASDGGAISQKSGVLNLTDCIIDSNVAGQTSSTVYGGAVRMTGGTATYTRCRFLSNVSNGNGTLRGGAIGIYSLESEVNLTLDNCYFSSNAASEGDDIYADKSFSNTITVSATHTTFSSSTDAIFNKDANITLTNCGDPTIAGDNSPAVTKVNTNSPSSVPNPVTATILSGDCSSGLVLPVELLYLTGKCINGLNELEWSTATENNNDYFLIQRSADAVNFVDIGDLNGHGNSNEIITYNFSDENPLDGISYYRLMQIDYNGNFNYSKTIAVKNDCINHEFIESVFYNQATNQIEIIFSQVTNDPLMFNLYDVSGKLLMSKNLEPDYLPQISVDLNANLSNSIYLISLKTKKFAFNHSLLIFND